MSNYYGLISLWIKEYYYHRRLRLWIIFLSSILNINNNSDLVLLTSFTIHTSLRPSKCQEIYPFRYVGGSTLTVSLLIITKKTIMQFLKLIFVQFNEYADYTGHIRIIFFNPCHIKIDETISKKGAVNGFGQKFCFSRIRGTIFSINNMTRHIDIWCSNSF